MTQQQSNGNSVVVQGRLVWTLGQSIFQGKQKTNQQTKQVVIDAKTGQPTIEYGFGIAIPKIDPVTGQFTTEYTKIWEALYKEAMTLFPGGQVPPTFAMKKKDGDTDIDEKGVPYSQREGYANHLVLSCTTQIPIKYFIYQGGNNVLVNDGVKCGDYVNVQLNIKAHPAVGTSKAGLYVNPSAVQLIASGKEIINTPSGDQMFGAIAPSYAGQVVAPVNAPMPGGFAPAPGMPPQQSFAQPQYPQQPMAPNPYPQQTQQYAPQPPMNAPVEPNYGVLPPQHQPQVPQQPSYPAPGMPPQQSFAQPQYPQQPMAPNPYPQMPGMPR